MEIFLTLIIFNIIVMDVKERINQFIENQCISNADLERELDLSSGAFRKVKNISSSFLVKFTRKYSLQM